MNKLLQLSMKMELAKSSVDSVYSTIYSTVNILSYNYRKMKFIRRINQSENRWKKMNLLYITWISKCLDKHYASILVVYR